MSAQEASREGVHRCEFSSSDVPDSCGAELELEVLWRDLEPGGQLSEAIWVQRDVAGLCVVAPYQGEVCLVEHCRGAGWVVGEQPVTRDHGPVCVGDDVGGAVEVPLEIAEKAGFGARSVRGAHDRRTWNQVDGDGRGGDPQVHVHVWSVR